MSRYKAAALHLLMSALILFSLFLLIANVWYPHKLFTLGAGVDLLKLVGFVDLVAGPLVMLIVFDARKKWMKLDIAIIVLCQVSFMAYGLWSIFVARPVIMAYVDHHFYLVRANEIDQKDLAAATLEQFRKLPLDGPILVATTEPSDPKVREDLLFAGTGGMGLQNLPKYYVPYATQTQDVIKSGKTLKQLGVDQSTKDRVAEYEKTLHRAVLYLPMVNKTKPLIVVVDANTGAFVDLI